MLAVLALAWSLAACGGHAGAATGPGTPSSTGTAPGTTGPTTTVAACSNASVIAGWPLARRAAMVQVVPVLNFDMQTVSQAAAAGAGGVLFLGNQPAPSGLGADLGAALHGAGPVAPMVMADEEGGGIQRLYPSVSSFPWPRDMARTMTAQAVRQLATRVGTQMRQAGVGVDLAPVLDVDGGVGPSATNPDGSRSFSPDPAVAASYGKAFFQGLEAGGVLPVVKHFPGLGGASANTDYGPATTPPLSTLEKVGLVPFRAAIAAGVPAVMVANAIVPGLTSGPASLSSAAIDGLLRTTLGFHGLVLTDSLSAGAITQAGYDLPRAVVAAISAGADMVLYGSTLTPAQTSGLSTNAVAATVNTVSSAIVQATRTGALPVSRLDAAVGHVLGAEHANLCG